uniref:Membrane protein n=1 Tax=uncultured Bacillota bacterium TaxID=344338 RepID=A0A650EN49_9FIRM|nr:membrane protein [uncultured Firmicutes bacterium]
MRKYLKKYKEFILYVLFGGLTTLVNMVVYFVLLHLFGEAYYLWFNAAAWLVSVLFAFVTNKLWVFESKRTDLATWLKEGIPFFGARAFSLFLDMGFMFVTVSLLDLPNGWMKLASNVVVVLVNYVFSKLIIFRKPKD